jgi:hypothetical protein
MGVQGKKNGEHSRFFVFVPPINIVGTPLGGGICLKVDEPYICWASAYFSSGASHHP